MAAPPLFGTRVALPGTRIARADHLGAADHALAWEHPLLLAIDGLPLNPDVKRHSIIASRGETVHPGGGDGLVPYASAHHPGATSELVVNAGHCCLEILEVVGEVARILKEHAIP
jgi:hypothetical protein